MLKLASFFNFTSKFWWPFSNEVMGKGTMPAGKDILKGFGGLRISWLTERARRWVIRRTAPRYFLGHHNAQRDKRKDHLDGRCFGHHLVHVVEALVALRANIFRLNKAPQEMPYGGIFLQRLRIGAIIFGDDLCAGASCRQDNDNGA